MRKLSTILVLVTALLLVLALALGAAGCGSATPTGAQNASQSRSNLSPQDILTAATTASQNMTSAKGTFEVSISFDVDPSTLPEEEKALVGEPIKASGTLAYAKDPRAGEFTLLISAAQKTMNVGMKMVGDKAWIQFMDQWYETPPEMQQALGQSGSQGTNTTDVQQMLRDLGIDLSTWLKDLRQVGEETINGTPAYHLAASPDVAKMLGDLVGLLESGKLMKAIDPSGSASGLMGATPSLPSGADMQEIQQQLGAMFHDVTADIWVAKDGFSILKFATGARMTPPPGEDAAGVNGITLSATVSLQSTNEPVIVEPPASAQPFSALQEAIQDNPGMLLGPLSGAAFGSASAVPEGTTY